MLHIPVRPGCYIMTGCTGRSRYRRFPTIKSVDHAGRDVTIRGRLAAEPRGGWDMDSLPRWRAAAMDRSRELIGPPLRPLQPSVVEVIEAEEAPIEPALPQADETMAAEQILEVAEGPLDAGEIRRRRDLLRGLFADFWTLDEDKPKTFAERLDLAEGFINDRLAACGEPWRLDRRTREVLGLPPPGDGCRA